MKSSILLILFFVKLAALAPAQTASTWVTFPAGTSHILVVGTDAAEVHIPILPAQGGPPVSEVTARVTNVVTQQPHPADLKRRFKLSVKEDDTQQGPELIATVSPLLEQPGVYTIVGELHWSKADGKPAQALTLQLERPAAKVSASPSLLFEQVQTWFGCASSSPTRLHLRETSKRSNLSPLTIEDRSERGAASAEFTSAILKLRKPIPKIEPGAQHTFELETSGTFPLGKTAGKLEVSAPQLSEPVLVAYEVRTRVHSAWLIIITLLGLGFGYAVKIGLQVWQERAKARHGLNEMRSRLEEARALLPDADFRAAIDEAMVRIEAELAQRDPAKLNAATQTAAAALESARTAFNTRRQQLEGELTSLLRLVRTRRQLPTKVAGLLAQGSRELDEAEAFLKARSVTAGRNAVERALQETFASLVNAAREWRRDVGSYFDALFPPGPPLTESASQQFQQGIQTWKNLAGSIPDPGVTVSVQTLSATLDAAARASSGCRDIAQQLTVWTSASAQEVRAALGSKPLPRPEQIERMERESAALGDAILADLDGPGAAAAAIKGRVLSLRQTWVDALLAQVPPGKDPAPTRAQLDAGHWLEAAHAIGQLANPPQTPLGGVPEGRKQATEQPAAPVKFQTVLLSPAEVAVTSPPAPRFREIERLRVSTVRELARAKLFQTFLVALLLSFVAYALFAERFVGTPRDFLAIFFWAFGMDLSVDAVLNAAKPLKPTGTI